MHRIGWTICAVLFSSIFVFAQDASQTSLKRGTVEIGLFTGGGTGLGKASSTQYFNSGVRLGKVLTSELGKSFFRGNLEFAVDLMPLYLVHQDRLEPAFVIVDGQPMLTQIKTGRQTVYGGGFNPFVLKWNFTRGRKIVPFFEADGGVLITTHDVPVPDSSNVNFTSGVAFGTQFFVSQRRAISISGHVFHLSNASLGDHNPGLNTNLIFRVGYHFYK